MEGKLKLTVSSVDSFGLPYLLGGVPALLELSLENLSDKEFSNLKIVVSSDDGTFLSVEYNVPLLSPRKTLRFSDFPSPSAEYLAELNDKTDLNILALVSKNDEVLEAVSHSLTLYPSNTWLGISFPKKIIASFVNSGDDYIKNIFSEKLSDAENIVFKERRTFEDIRNVVERIYDFILSGSVSRISNDISLFEIQKVRSFPQILESKSASLLEMSLLYLTLLEKCSVYGCLYFTEDKSSVKIGKGRDFIVVSINNLLNGLSFADNIASPDRNLIKEGVSCDLADCREDGILPLSDYDIYESVEKKSYENILFKQNSVLYEITDSKTCVFVSSPVLRRASYFIKNDVSFIFDCPVFSDYEKLYAFFIKRFIEYGKTATFLFESKGEKESFEKILESILPDVVRNNAGLIDIKALISFIFEERSPRFEKDMTVLSEEEAKLESFSSMLKDKRFCGLSFSDVVALADELSDVSSPFELSDDYVEKATMEKTREDLTLCGEFSRLAYILKDVELADLEKFGFSSLSESDIDSLKVCFEERNSSAYKLEQTERLFAEILGVEIDSYEKLRAAAELSQIILSDVFVPASLIEYKHLYDIKDIVSEVAAAGRLRDEAERFICENFNKDIFSYNAVAALKQWTEASEKRSVLRNHDYGKIKKAVAVFAFEPSKLKNEDIFIVLKRLCEYRENRDKVLTLGASVSPIFGTAWNRGYCDWDSFENCYVAACRIRKIIDGFSSKTIYGKGSRNNFILNINSDAFMKKYRPLFKTTVAEFKKLSDTEQEISKFCSDNFSELYRKYPLNEVLDITKKTESQLGYAPILCEYSKLKNSLSERGLSDIIEKIEKEPNMNESAVAFYLKSLSLSVLSLILKNNGKIVKYGGSFFKKRLDGIASVKRRVEKEENSEIFKLSVSKKRKMPEFEEEIGFLKKEAELKPQISVSRLKKNCPLIYALIFPVTAALVSSVSQNDERDFLIVSDRGNIDAETVNDIVKRFNSVILFSDASINKGELLSFMRNSGFEILRYRLTSDKINSKLALCAKSYLYSDSLRVLPNRSKNLNFTEVNGLCSNGVNVEEISEIYRLLSDILRADKEDIVVKIASLSEKQAKAIGFFIDKKMTLPKNVSVVSEVVRENFTACDYLILSTVFSGEKNETRYFTDINKVLGTEENFLRYLLLAKKQTVIVSSLGFFSNNSLDLFSPVVRLIRGLRESFYDLSKKSSLFIDGVLMKNDIYADALRKSGVTYEKSRYLDNLYTERESENCILYDISENIIEDFEIEQYLISEGYKVFREFSSDRLKEIFLPEKSPDLSLSFTQYDKISDNEREDNNSPNFLRYEICTFDNKPDMSENAEEFMAGYNNPDIRKDIISVVKAESPVSLRTLSKRVLSHWGISRCGVRLENKIESLASHLDLYIEACGSLKFYWNGKEEQKRMSYFRIPDGKSFRREIVDIAPEELANVYKYIADEYKLIAIDAADRELIKILGFTRVTQKVRKHLAKSLEIAEKRGYLKTVKNKIIGN